MLAISNELRLWPRMPVMLMGDLNARIPQVHSLHWQVAAGHWHDSGAVASTWGPARDAEPTAHAHGCKAPSRTDYALANDQARGLIRSFELLGFDHVDVHTPLKVTPTSGAPQAINEVHVPGAIDLGQAPDIGQIHRLMDANLIQHQQDLEHALQHNDTSQFLTCWSACLEEALLEAGGIPLHQRRPFKGRGRSISRPPPQSGQ